VLQTQQQQQQAADPAQLAAAPKTTTASAETTAALKEASITVAPTASHATQELAKAASAVPTDKLSSRVGTQQWDQQLGQKIIFMAAGGEQSATMELNPPDLGPLQVVLSVNKDQATAAFSSAAPEVRQALESALPKLKEMMSEAGIQLGSATVSAGMSDQNNSAFSQQASSAQSGSGNGSNRAAAATGRDTGSDAEAARTTQPARRLPAGAVDTFACQPPSPANRERRPALRFCCLLHYGNAKQQRERPSFQRIQLRRPDR
jgi:flagellar hook-length control protein FliK